MFNYYNKTNFHKYSYCEFELTTKDFFEENLVHYKSKSGSLYYYTKEGVYRYSNHWGRVANCRWKISGVEVYKNQNYYVGYAAWQSFFSLKNNEKEFYLKFDFETKTTAIFKINDENNSQFLMTLGFALKRQKEITTLLKNSKWAFYYNESVEIVQAKLIHKLLNSDETLQVLKRSLKNTY